MSGPAVRARSWKEVGFVESIPVFLVQSKNQEDLIGVPIRGSKAYCGLYWSPRQFACLDSRTESAVHHSLWSLISAEFDRLHSELSGLRATISYSALHS